MAHDDENADRDPLVLLRALGSDMPPPPGAARNVLDRLLVSIPAAMSGATSMASGDSPHSDGGMNEVISSHAAMRAGQGFFSNGVVAVTRPWAWAVGLTMAGGVAGGALHATLAPHDVRVVYVERPSGRDSRLPAEHSSGAIEGTPPEALVPSSTTALPTSPERPTPSEAGASGSTPADSALAKERALLDAARRALASGDLGACLNELAQHARAFPAGKLAEEREAMAVNALVGVGRYAEARQKADRFARRHPNSFLAPSVKAAIAAIP
jgi:hypothetical protein